ncbi:MAG: hypothetical protein IJP16_02925 [Clostridia bacterium]|nr:hypothetical protein [Clostridia bacterium]
MTDKTIAERGYLPVLEENMTRDKMIAERGYLPVLEMNDGTPVTLENWEERRAEMLELLEKYCFGRTPRKPDRVWGDVVESAINWVAGKALYQKVNINFEIDGMGVCTFPITIHIPYKVVRPNVFLHIAFNQVPEKYTPLEEILDAGWAVIVVNYKDLVNDNIGGDFTNGIGAYFKTPENRKGDEWGKVGMWAYGASRIMDYLVSERAEDLDVEHVAVIGHSRLGKTALWCAAQDERFAAAISNNSGQGGASSSKHTTGELVYNYERAGSWNFFCENHRRFVGLEDEKPFDQAMLLALIAPRYLLVGSARLDIGADPIGEYLTSYHASSAWELFGLRGLVCPDRLPEVDDHFTEGHISYHLRDDLHYLSRYDWQRYISYLDEKFGKKEFREYHVPI